MNRARRFVNSAAEPRPLRDTRVVATRQGHSSMPTPASTARSKISFAATTSSTARPTDLKRVTSLGARRPSTLPAITPNQVSELLAHALRSTPTMYDSHPPTELRIAHAVSPRWDGVFRGDGDARRLFEDFPALCRAASVHCYEQLVGTGYGRDHPFKPFA